MAPFPPTSISSLELHRDECHIGCLRAFPGIDDRFEYVTMCHNECFGIYTTSPFNVHNLFSLRGRRMLLWFGSKHCIAVWCISGWRCTCGVHFFPYFFTVSIASRIRGWNCCFSWTAHCRTLDGVHRIWQQGYMEAIFLPSSSPDYAQSAWTRRYMISQYEAGNALSLFAFCVMNACNELDCGRVTLPRYSPRPLVTPRMPYPKQAGVMSFCPLARRLPTAPQLSKRQALTPALNPH